jgi:prepilin peptidase CpaA
VTTLDIALILTRAVALALLLRIAVVDFQTQRIANRDVTALAASGLAALAIGVAQGGRWDNLTFGVIAAVALFLVLFPFWMMRKVGAGDVKLMAAAPLVTGADHLFPFALMLMVASIAVVIVLKNALRMPEWAFRRYVEVLDRKGVVPFGVPISAALIGVLVMQAATAVGIAR